MSKPSGNWFWTRPSTARKRFKVNLELTFNPNVNYGTEGPYWWCGFFTAVQCWEENPERHD